MKTVRFSKVVEVAGQPEVYLLWLEPTKDATLQKALKAHKVMTIHQVTVGTKKDHGTVGLEDSPTRQILIFPQSLEEFAGREVIGINYDLLKPPPEDSGSSPDPVDPAPAKGKSAPDKMKASAERKPTLKQKEAEQLPKKGRRTRKEEEVLQPEA